MPSLPFDILASVSHDLRTPLTGLREFLSIVLDGLAGPLSGLQQEYLGIALRNADTLSEMIEHLLVLARMQEGNLHLARRRVSFEAMLHPGSLLQKAPPRGKTVHLDVAVAAGLPDVYIDPDRVLEAVRNLVDNAVKYSRSEVSIRVEARRGSAGFLEIRVKDDGLGIDPATRRHLFRRFYRGDQAAGTSGLGLGLSIVKEIVELHGGRIRVRSRKGVGTEVTLSFPRFDPQKMLIELIQEGLASPLGRVGGIGFVRTELKDVRGAVQPTRQDALGRAREILTRTMGLQDVMLGDSARDGGLCFLIQGSRARMESSIDGIRRTVAERLLFQSGIQVEWEDTVGRIHSDDYGTPESMAEAILQRWYQPKE